MTESLTLFLCGDVMLGRGIDQILPHPGDPLLRERYVGSAMTYVQLAEQVNGPIPAPVDFGYVWGDALDELRRAPPQVRMINLETSVTKSRDYMPKGINYKMNPENVACLTAAEVDCCVLANNHVLDFGATGLCETLEVLKQAGIRSAGAGRNATEAQGQWSSKRQMPAGCWSSHSDAAAAGYRPTGPPAVIGPASICFATCRPALLRLSPSFRRQLDGREIFW
jgi:poly-gamma-glutamate capsule biosynthesis protein CapA/YwtB (metallophosphatase superfamily)